MATLCCRSFTTAAQVGPRLHCLHNRWLEAQPIVPLMLLLPLLITVQQCPVSKETKILTTRSLLAPRSSAAGLSCAGHSPQAGQNAGKRGPGHGGVLPSVHQRVAVQASCLSCTIPLFRRRQEEMRGWEGSMQKA